MIDNNLPRLSPSQITQLSQVKSGFNPPPQGTTPSSASAASQDTVEISQQGQFLSQINGMPSIRVDKVESVRQQLANNDYDIDAHLSEAIDLLFDEHNIG
jgi:anti-sigma28 factor (negative regulator of flagellin synthesis)